MQKKNDHLGFGIKIFFMVPGQSDYGVSGWGFEQFVAAIHSSGTGIWKFEVSSCSLFVCKRCSELLGLPDCSIVELDLFTNFLSDPYKEQVISLFTKSITKKECFSIEFPITIFKDPAPKWLRLTGNTASFDEYSKLTMYGTITDVTEKKRTEELRKDLLLMVAHDLRSPLSAIKLLVQMVNRIAVNLRNQTIISYLSKAEHLIEKVNRMIQCLLEVSEFEYGKMNILPGYFNITDLLVEAVEDMKLLNASHQFILRTKPCLQIYADKDKINQVIQNFLSNAIKYSPGAEKVIIECKKMNKELRVSFTDFGIGINTLNQKKVFERFYRVDSNQTKVIEGYGIGLYLCKQIILAHGGDIGVKSQLNQGSTFFFSLPISANDKNRMN